MNLLELYDTLIPSDNGDKVFNAIPIPDYQNFRIATDYENNPVLLLSIANAVKNIALKNFRLKYLQLEQNIECKITENNKTFFSTFTVITFRSSDKHLQEYFLRISETLIKSLNTKPTQQQIIETLNKFIEVFRSLADAPTNTIQGLWSELFFIDNCKLTKNVLTYWHNIPEEKFDFNAGEEKVEIKSNSNFERTHTFSSEQLHPLKGTQVLIASIFTKQNNSGINIQELIDSITTKISNDFDLVDKLNAVVCKTLGSSFEQSIRIKFDYQIAKDSLRFYKHQEISKIEEIHIPNEVTEVRYRSDLKDITPIIPNTLGKPLLLFQSIN